MGWLLSFVALTAACGGQLVGVSDAAGTDAAGGDAQESDASQGLDLAAAELDMSAPLDLSAAEPPPITDVHQCMATPQPSKGLPNGVVLQRQCTGMFASYAPYQVRARSETT